MSDKDSVAAVNDTSTAATPKFEHPNGVKHVAETHVTATHLVKNEDINGANRLFGGRLMEWIDELAGMAARRHSGTAITTAAVDKLEFRHPALVNDIVVIDAWVTHVERSSMEVRVDTYVEDPALGTRLLVNQAYLTEVCVDEHGHPIANPWGLVADTDEEHAECDGARMRAELRKLRRAQGI